MSDDDRRERDFFARPPQDRAILMHATWCEVCDVGEFELSDPEEYASDGRVFLAGRCPFCGGSCLTEIIERPNKTLLSLDQAASLAQAWAGLAAAIRPVPRLECLRYGSNPRPESNYAYFEVVRPAKLGIDASEYVVVNRATGTAEIRFSAE